MDGNIWQSPGGSLVTSAAGLPLAAAGGGTPWSLILPILLSLIPSLFQGDESEQMMERGTQMQQIMRTLGMKPPYQSPYTSTMDKAMVQALMNQIMRTQGWGWPAGKQMDLSFFENLTMPATTGRRVRLG